ncbi:MAG: formylglycine-generating enzyme family protein, partial [Cyanobacteria bacterium P01_D01_bin.73]
PQHRVTFSEGFWMGRYPVTQAQWRMVAGFDSVNRELDSDPAGFKGDQRPVEKVSWEDAQEFCHRLSNKFPQEFKLPGEAQWEYACRAGTTTPFHFGETIDATLANYWAQDRKSEDETYPGVYGQGSYGEFREQTTDIGIFPANRFGLHDMHGNVREWCEDTWHDSYNGVPNDGTAWIGNDAKYRLLRGGSWFDTPGFCRSAYRYVISREYRDDIIGFRVCCVAPKALSL